MIIDEEVYLKHYGVKGMQWGVRQKYRDRRAKSSQKEANIHKEIALKRPNSGNVYAARQAQSRADRANRWAKGKPTKGDKTRRAISAAVLVGLGAVVVSSFMSNHGHTPIKNLPKNPTSNVEQFIRKEHATQLSSLTRMHSEGKMDADQFKKFSESLAKRYDRKVAEALGSSLKRGAA